MRPADETSAGYAPLVEVALKDVLGQGRAADVPGADGQDLDAAGL